MSNSMSANRLWVAGITLLAAALRFPFLGQLPPGLYHDEAINGLDALRVLNGATPIFFTANNGREPLFIYLIAGTIAFLGRSVLAVRVVSAVLGTLTVPATYLMGRRLFDRRVGLLTAAMTALTVWPINLSRIGFRAVAMPLFVALMIWALWSGHQQRASRDRNAWCWFALAGIFAGTMLYTYLTARFVPIVFLAFIGYLIFLRQPRENRTQHATRNTQHAIPWRGFLIFLCVAAIIAAPLLGYFVTHRAEAARRAFQVSILNPGINAGDPVGTLLRHLGRTLLMFNLRGDFIPRHNVPLRPVFDPLLSLCFLLGLVVAARRWREPAYGFILIWTAVMLLPTALAEDAPHFLRAVGILPVVFVFPVIGLEAGIRWLGDRWSPVVAGTALTVVLIASLGLTTYDYFLKHARSENAYYQFEAGAVELAHEVNNFLDNGPDGQAYVDRTLWEGWAAVRFLVPQSPRVTILSETVPAPPAEPPILLALWPFQDLSRYFGLLPQRSTISVEEGAKERGDLEPEARLLYVLFRASRRTDAGPPLAYFGDNIVLQAAEVNPLSDRQLQVRLTWECTEPLNKDYRVTAQLLRGGDLITQDDGPPAGGYYPTTAWRAGDRVIDKRTLDLPAPYEPANQQLIVAVYDPGTLERLPVTQPDGQPLGDHYTLQNQN